MDREARRATVIAVLSKHLNLYFLYDISDVRKNFICLEGQMTMRKENNRMFLLVYQEVTDSSSQNAIIFYIF